VALYGYKCLRSHSFDELHPLGQAPDSTKCPEDGTTAKRTIEAPSVHFKGQGFSRSSAQ
jgi:putative FmdB family regulatory protein